LSRESFVGSLLQNLVNLSYYTANYLGQRFASVGRPLEAELAKPSKHLYED